MRNLLSFLVFYNTKCFFTEKIEQPVSSCSFYFAPIQKKSLRKYTQIHYFKTHWNSLTSMESIRMHTA